MCTVKVLFCFVNFRVNDVVNDGVNSYCESVNK